MDKTGQNVQIFEEVLFFQAPYNIKTEKQTIHCFYVLRSLGKENFLENLHILSCSCVSWNFVVRFMKNKISI